MLLVAARSVRDQELQIIALINISANASPCNKFRSTPVYDARDAPCFGSFHRLKFCRLRFT